jgi:hypothetical protein
VPTNMFAGVEFSHVTKKIYHCNMRDELKHLFSKQITLNDGSQFYYTIQPFEMKNIFGAAIAILDEYVFTKKGATETHKLYRTKERNWYDIAVDIETENHSLFRALKSAIEATESGVITS